MDWETLGWIGQALGWTGRRLGWTGGYWGGLGGDWNGLGGDWAHLGWILGALGGSTGPYWEHWGCLLPRSRLDCEAKQWRLAADLLNDLGLLLELLAPGWPWAAPALLALGTAAKCVVGVAGGATRVALAAHQARRDNMADVAAKDSSQETLVNGLGLLLALLLLPLLDGRPWLSRAVFGVLLCTHFWANVGAVGSLRLPSLNRPRLRLVLRGGAEGGGGGATLGIPGPDDVNGREPLLPGWGSRLRQHLGAPLHLLVHSEAEFQKALECGTPDYIIVLRPSQGWVGVGLRRGTPPGVLLGACAHALLLEELLGPELPQGTHGAALRPLQRSLRSCPPGKVPWGVVAESTRVWRMLGPSFLRGLEAAGWQMQRHLLAPDEWQLDWDTLGDPPKTGPFYSLFTPPWGWFCAIFPQFWVISG
ncbi:LOW QUALITY PROTEIN: RUS family member 1 [Porphyrio hochstetteri]